MIDLEPLAQQLLAARRLLIATHAAPDGDGVGCQLALRQLLAGPERGVTAVVIGELPPRFRFLPGSGTLRDWTAITEDQQLEFLASHDQVLVVDTHVWSMLGPLGDVLRRADVPTVFLDHHPIEGDAPPNLFCDPKASSAGEICWHLTRALRLPVSADAATSLYAAISYDTNSFKYLRRRAETHRIAAELVDRGADTDAVYRHLFASHSLAKVALTGEISSRLHLEEGGLVAWMVIDQELLTRTRATPDDLREVITQLIEIEGVEIALLFKQRQHGNYKVSLRSKGRYAVSPVTRELGGGGHAFAAGANLDGAVEDVTARVLGLVGKVIAEFGA